LGFESLLGYATIDEIARVQVSTDGGITWQDIYTQAGSGGSGETTFTPHTLSLSAYAGNGARVRFDYGFSAGKYYPQTSPNVGWCLENIVVTNAQQVLNLATNSTPSTNFIFTPLQTGDYVLQSRGVLFDEFPLEFGTAKEVTAVVGPPVITLTGLAISGSQATINFTRTSGSASSYNLLQLNQLGGPWTTNAGAVLATNAPGNSFQFTTTIAQGARFYRVGTP
jgi:hypothetical protein